MSSGDATPTATAAVNDDDDDEVVFVSSQNRVDRKCEVIIDLDALPDTPDTETPSRNNTPGKITPSTPITRKRRHRTQRQLFNDDIDTVYTQKRTAREVEQRQCRICKTELTFFNVFVGADCRHSFCQDCTLSYLMKITEVPISCLHNECNCQLHSHAVLSVLETAVAVTDEHRRKRETLQRLYVKHESISTLAYCSNRDCATPFDFEPGSSTDDPQANKIRCPLCGTFTCARCGVQWHEGMTCDEYGQILRRRREREAAERAALEREKGVDGVGNEGEGQTQGEAKNGNAGDEQSKEGDLQKNGDQDDSNSKEGSMQGDSPQGQQDSANNGSSSGSVSADGEEKGSVD